MRIDIFADGFWCYLCFFVRRYRGYFRDATGLAKQHPVQANEEAETAVVLFSRHFNLIPADEFEAAAAANRDAAGAAQAAAAQAAEAAAAKALEEGLDEAEVEAAAAAGCTSELAARGCVARTAT